MHRGAAQLRPRVVVVPVADQRALLHRRGRVVCGVSRVLRRDEREVIAAGAQRADVGEDAVAHPLHVAAVDTPEVGRHVVVGAERQQALARGGFPAVERRTVEGNQRPVSVRAHGQVLHAQVGQVVGQAPRHAVHVVLHGRLDRDAQFVEPGDRLEEGLVGVLAREFRHVEEHRGHLDLSVLHVVQELVDLLLRTDAQPFAHGPRGLARPAELRVVGVILRCLAVLQGVVDVAQVLGQDLRLGFRVADVGVGVLYEVDRPALRGKDLRVEGLPVAVRLQGEGHLPAVVSLGNAHLQAVQARGEAQLAARFPVVAPRRFPRLGVPVRDVQHDGMQLLVRCLAVDERGFRNGREERHASFGRGRRYGHRGLQTEGVENHPAARYRADREDVVSRAEGARRDLHLCGEPLRRSFPGVEVVLIRPCRGLELRAESVDRDFKPGRRSAVYLDKVEGQAQGGGRIGLLDRKADQNPSLDVPGPGIRGPGDDERDVGGCAAADGVERNACREALRKGGIPLLVEREFGGGVVGFSDLPHLGRVGTGSESRPRQAHQDRQDRQSAMLHGRMF